jgi:hypothetical protein
MESDESQKWMDLNLSERQDGFEAAQASSRAEAEGRVTEPAETSDDGGEKFLPEKTESTVAAESLVVEKEEATGSGYSDAIKDIGGGDDDDAGGDKEDADDDVLEAGTSSKDGAPMSREEGEKVLARLKAAEGGALKLSIGVESQISQDAPDARLTHRHALPEHPVVSSGGGMVRLVWMIVIVHLVALAYLVRTWSRQPRTGPTMKTASAAAPPQKVGCVYEFVGLPKAVSKTAQA